MVQEAGCRVQGVGCRVQGAGCRVWDVGCRVQGAGCGVWGVGHKGRPGETSTHMTFSSCPASVVMHVWFSRFHTYPDSGSAGSNRL